ncbi:hypothetical protein Vau01_016350 [Virgisporangium aurantiacum]|uniref:Transposase DDE domain-containing protein n=1 Tax=Virgisporangium aurantiacum TaxID=175570 RepID=A0A8J3YYP5_9ACTN|nr:hypothetical protein Vau01_016350 [Virgisporangium aurantiacum]
MALLDSIAPIRSRRGGPRHRPAKLHADKAYDVPALRAEVRRRGIAVRIARKAVESSKRLGRHRWVVEACLSWLQPNRRPGRRYERKAEHFQALPTSAAPYSPTDDSPRSPSAISPEVAPMPRRPARAASGHRGSERPRTQRAHR